jgi:hypothetical protein
MRSKPKHGDGFGQANEQQVLHRHSRRMVRIRVFEEEAGK